MNARIVRDTECVITCVLSMNTKAHVQGKWCRMQWGKWSGVQRGIGLGCSGGNGLGCRGGNGLGCIGGNGLGCSGGNGLVSNGGNGLGCSGGQGNPVRSGGISWFLLIPITSQTGTANKESQHPSVYSQQRSPQRKNYII